MASPFAWLWSFAAESAPISPAADTTQAAGGGLVPGLRQYEPILFIGLMLVVLYFIMIAPQRKKDKERRKMLDALAKGDQVVTIGGLHGTVWQVKEQEVVLTVADNTRMTFSRGAIAQITKPDAEVKT